MQKKINLSSLSIWNKKNSFIKTSPRWGVFLFVFKLPKYLNMRHAIRTNLRLKQKIYENKIYKL